MSTNPRNHSPTPIRTPSIEDLAVRSGITAEHVVLSGEEPAIPERVRSNAVRERLRLRNHATGTETIIKIFHDGYLTASERRRGDEGRELAIDLRFVDPSPRLSRTVARTSLLMAQGCIGASVLSTACAFFGLLPLVSWSVSAAAVAGTIVALAVYVRHRRERIEFLTMHGRTVVLTLIANLGSLRAHRRALPKLVAAIREAQRLNTADKQLRLREEMREHYRLASAGSISEEACTAAARKILERF